MIAVAMRAVAVIAASLGVLAIPAAPAAADQEAAPPCATADLSLRQVKDAASPAPDVETVYMLENLGLTACTVSGGVGIRLFDAQGKLIDVRFAVRNTMAMLVTLAPGAAASFSVSFAPHASMESVAAARIDVLMPPQRAPISAPTTVAVYVGPAVRVSNLRLSPPARSKLMFP